MPPVKHEGVRLIWGFPLALQKMMPSASIPRNKRGEASRGGDSMGSGFSRLAALTDLGSEALVEPFILCLARFAGQPETGGGRLRPQPRRNARLLCTFVSKSHGQSTGVGGMSFNNKAALVWRCL